MAQTSTLEKQYISQYPEVEWYEGQFVTIHGLNAAGGLAERKRVLASLDCLDKIIQGDYQGFIAPQLAQVKAGRKAPESVLQEAMFNSIRSFVLKNVSTVELLDTMKVIISIHDITKSVSFAQRLRSEFNIQEQDLDRLLGAALKQNPNIFPSVARLPSLYKILVVRVLGPGLNSLQFVQGECLLEEVTDIKNYVTKDSEAAPYFIIFELFDLAGAAATVPGADKGSLTLDQPTAENYFGAWNIINSVNSPKDIYYQYMKFRGDRVRLNIPDNNVRFALSRIAAAGRLSLPEDGIMIENAYLKLNIIDQAILVAELNNIVSPTTPQSKELRQFTGTFLYYLPQLIVDRLAGKIGSAKVEGLIQAMNILSRIYEYLRNLLGPEAPPVPRTVNLVDFVNFLKTNPERYELELFGDYLTDINRAQNVATIQQRS